MNLYWNVESAVLYGRGRSLIGRIKITAATATELPIHDGFAVNSRVRRTQFTTRSVNSYLEKNMTPYLIYLAILSLVAFVVYVNDKKKAKKGKWRTKEATLLSLSFLGGALGGYLAMFFGAA